MGEVILWAYSVIGASAVLVLTAWGAMELLDRLPRPSIEERLINLERRIRGNIHADARWFSEDPPTMAAIEGLADGRRIDEVRDDWRRARAAQKAMDAKNAKVPDGT